MRVAEAEDALNVLIESFGYIIYNIGDAGITLRKDGSHRIVIQLPYGTPTIPEDVLAHVFQHADFPMDAFWEAFDKYLAE
jgi:hypothetical protein